MSLLNTGIASRLCKACGLCCNGVMFHTVRLQAADNPQDLVKSGLHIQRKKGGHLFQQPCPAYRESCCSIYDLRPTRCRLFQCRQLKRLSAGETTEAEALEKIQNVQTLVSTITKLLNQAGPTNEKRPLAKRCEKILAEPATEPEMIALHQRLTQETRDLELILDADFRIVQTD